MDGGYIGENVILGSFKNSFQNSQIGDNTAGVEMLVAVEDQMVSMISDLEVIITGIDSS